MPTEVPYFLLPSHFATENGKCLVQVNKAPEKGKREKIGKERDREKNKNAPAFLFFIYFLFIILFNNPFCEADLNLRCVFPCGHRQMQ